MKVLYPKLYVKPMIIIFIKFIMIFVIFENMMFENMIFADEIDLSKLPASSEKKVDFTKEIRPLFEKSCFGCHGSKPRAKSKYFMNNREGTIKGGSSKEAAIVVGKSVESPLVHYVSDLIEDLEMPPLDKRDKYPMLTKKQIGMIMAWIDQGAKWPDGVELTLPE